MDQSRLQIIKFGSVVPALAKIWVLIDRTGDQAGDFCHFLLVIAEDEREGCSKCRC